MKVIILAAGVGSRLGRPFPKSLIKLKTGETIMERQLSIIGEFISIDDTGIVVGFKKSVIMEVCPDASFIYNPYFSVTNTSKSLLRGLKKMAGSDVLWLNGDLVFERNIMERVIAKTGEGKPFCVVNGAKVGEEEVKYKSDENGNITEISKQVTDAEGEAVGINFITADKLDELIKRLNEVDDNDYFEKGMENAIKDKSITFSKLDISPLNCIEIDFLEDLMQANSFF